MYIQGGKVNVLANHAGERSTPTLVAYRKNETVSVPTCQDEVYYMYLFVFGH